VAESTPVPSISEPGHAFSHLPRRSETILRYENREIMVPKKPMNSYFTALRQSLSQERHVVFAELVEVSETPASNNISDSAFGCGWWTWEEYKKIADNNRITLRKMMADKSFSDDDAEFCWLGLQGYAETEIEKRKNHKQRVKTAILKAQAFQRIDGIHDSVYLAELSRTCTKASREQAFLRAFTDRDTPKELFLQFQMNELNLTTLDLVEVKI
jgi:hypothetical protein